jgi:hypothetical protein
MKEGYIPIFKGRLYWSPKEKRMYYNVFSIPEGGVVLSERSMGMPKKAISYYCIDCELVITPKPKELDK